MIDFDRRTARWLILGVFLGMGASNLINGNWSEAGFIAFISMVWFVIMTGPPFTKPKSD